MDIQKKDVLRVQLMKNRGIMLSIMVMLIALVLSALPAAAQEIIAEVNATTETLPTNKKEDLRDFPDKLEQYINTFEWTGGDYPYSLDCQIGVFFEDVRTTYEDRYRGRFYINSETGIQFVDKYWDFAYNRGDVLDHNPAEFSPLLGLVDYYIYLVLGEEMDKLGALQGTPYYQKALELCNMGRFCRLPRWWDERARDVQEILRDDHKPFRTMLVQLEQVLFYMDDGNSEDARGLSLVLFQVLEGISHIERERRFLAKFFNKNYKELLRIAKIHEDDTIYQTLLTVDSEHGKYYKSNW